MDLVGSFNLSTDRVLKSKMIYTKKELECTLTIFFKLSYKAIRFLIVCSESSASLK